MLQRVVFTKEALVGILEYSRASHPSEGILLLRGKIKGGEVKVTELVIPPEAIHGESFSSFNPYMLPLDASIVGVAHSHPSGNTSPSDEDMLHFYGRVSVIVGYPYRSLEDVAAYDAEERRIPCSAE